MQKERQPKEVVKWIPTVNRKKSMDRFNAFVAQIHLNSLNGTHSLKSKHILIELILDFWIMSST